MVKTRIIKELKCQFCGKELRQEVDSWVLGGKEICVKKSQRDAIVSKQKNIGKNKMSLKE